jgi:hypothetical protein
LEFFHPLHFVGAQSWRLTRCLAIRTFPVYRRAKLAIGLVNASLYFLV